MRRFKYLSILVLILSACSSNKSEEELQASANYKNLNGYWGCEIECLQGETRTILLSIEDSSDCYFSPLEKKGVFSLTGNGFKISSGKLSYQFRIISFNDTTLLVVPNHSAQHLVNEFLFINPDSNKGQPSIDTIIFHRLFKKNGMEIKEILFRSSPCPVNCKSMYLKVSKGGIVEYYGSKDTQFNEGFSGNIKEDALNVLLDHIQLLDTNQIEPRFTRIKTDQQSWDLIIKEKNGRVIKTSVHAQGNEPVALRALINYLESLPEELNLIKNPDVSPKSFLELGHPYTIELDD